MVPTFFFVPDWSLSVSLMHFFCFKLYLCFSGSLTLSAHAEDYSSHFVCLSVCLSVADLEDGDTFSASKRHELKLDDNLCLFNLPHFLNSALLSRRSEKLCRSSAP